jgi:hypothetical protein
MLPPSSGCQNYGHIYPASHHNGENDQLYKHVARTVANLSYGKRREDELYVDNTTKATNGLLRTYEGSI